MKAHIRMKWCLFLSIILSYSHVFGYGYHVHYPETFYINNNSVLLYKVINWWYDSPHEASKQLCGSHMKYQVVDNARVEYNEAGVLKIRIKGGFTDQLSIFKQCKMCFGPSYLKCTWLNKKYFGNGSAMTISKNFSTESTLVMKGIDKKYGRLMVGIEHDLMFESEGVIGGLLNGKIALHRAGTFLKKCSPLPDGRGDHYPFSLKVINSRTKEMLAEYTEILKN